MNTQFKGAFLIIISAFFYASYGLWTKMIAGGFGEFNQAWIRGLVLLGFLVPFGIFTKKFKTIERKDWKWFIIISLAGGLNQAPYFFGYKHLAIGTATITFYTMLTIGAYFIGTFFFSERLTTIKWVSLVSAVFGMGFLYTFSLHAEDLLPFFLMSLAGLMGATGIVFSKKLSSQYSETQILTSFLISMIFFNGIISMVLKETLNPDMTNVVGEIGYIFAYLIANAGAVAGFRYVEPSIGGLIGLVVILFGVLFGILFFNEVITIHIFIGGVIILGAIALPDVWKIVHRV